MAKRRRSTGNTPLERLALFKARPVNRDTLSAVDYKPAKGKPKIAPARTPIQPKPLDGPPKVAVVKASEEAERKAKTRRIFGFKSPQRGA